MIQSFEAARAALLYLTPHPLTKGPVTFKADELRENIGVLSDALSLNEVRSGQPRIYLDLDGVMADFDTHFPALFGVSHKSMLDNEMWAQINANPTFFRSMPVMDGALDFFESIRHLQPIILTACPRSDYANVAQQKRAWVREHLSKTVTILPVMGGRNKFLFMHQRGDVLIDDWDKNIEAWRLAGGIGILHRTFEDTRQLLNLALSDI